MRREITIDTYKDFLIKKITSGSQRINELLIVYPNGNYSQVCAGSIDACKRIIDTFLKSQVTIWDVIEKIVTPGGCTIVSEQLIEK